jgi:hypothetical protein
MRPATSQRVGVVIHPLAQRASSSARQSGGRNVREGTVPADRPDVVGGDKRRFCPLSRKCWPCRRIASTPTAPSRPTGRDRRRCQASESAEPAIPLSEGERLPQCEDRIADRQCSDEARQVVAAISTRAGCCHPRSLRHQTDRRRPTPGRPRSTRTSAERDVVRMRHATAGDSVTGHDHGPLFELARIPQAS